MAETVRRISVMLSNCQYLHGKKGWPAKLHQAFYWCRCLQVWFDSIYLTHFYIVLWARLFFSFIVNIIIIRFYLSGWGPCTWLINCYCWVWYNTWLSWCSSTYLCLYTWVKLFLFIVSKK